MMLRFIFCFCLLSLTSGLACAQTTRPITFNTNFEGASLGRIEKLDDATFRCHVRGQCDERGRNRQASWYYFRMDRVQGRDITLTLTDFVGEYNDKPGACPMNADTVPVFSYDGEHWQLFPAMDWDNEQKEATIRFRPDQDTIWIAHIPPYAPARLNRLLAALNQRPHVRVEVIGKTAQGRDLNMVTITDFQTPDAAKKTVWLQARQHAWESGTSFVAEGAMNFVASDDPIAAKLRQTTVFVFTPMMDPDGCANGQVRFNTNNYDVNRHWNEVDLRNKDLLALMPEIWYVKKALFAYVDSGRPIDVMINMHNDESPEYLETRAADPRVQKRLQRLFDTLSEKTSFDPSKNLVFAASPTTTTNCLYDEKKIPVMLMEQRIGTSKKLNRRPTVEDRMEFGRQLIQVMAECAK